MDLTHNEIEELLGVYALDAVSPAEAEAVELHLRDCPRCRSEVAEHREVAASLAHVGSSAPANVWSRIAGSLEEVPPQLDMARVVSMEGRRRRSLPLRPVAALVAAAAVVIAALGIQVSHLDDRTDQLAAALQEEGLDEAVQAALFDEGARRVDLRSEDGATFAQAVVRDNGDGFLVRDNLPGLSDDRTYQVWAMVGDRPVSVGVLGSDPGTSAFKVAADGVSVLAVTAEQAGGVVAPTGDPVVRGFLPVT